MFIYKRCKCEPKVNAIQPKSHNISLARLLKLVSVPSRLYILALLGNGPHCVCDIMTHSNMSQTLASHHLADLTKAGLIENRKNGQFVDYSLTKKGLILLSQLEKISAI